MASGQPGFLANFIDAKLLWSVATCYPEKHIFCNGTVPSSDRTLWPRPQMPQPGRWRPQLLPLPRTCFQEVTRSHPP